MPVGLKFGPYEGQITDDGDACSCLINKGRNCSENVDRTDKSLADWMRYVRCVGDEEEEKLEALACHRPCRLLKPGCGLLVWCGDKNDRHVDSEWTREFTAEKAPKPEIHPCPFCSLACSIQNFLNRHMKISHPSGILPGTFARKHRQSENFCPHDHSYSDPHEKCDKPRNDVLENEKEDRESSVPLSKKTRHKGIQTAFSRLSHSLVESSDEHETTVEETTNSRDTGRVATEIGMLRIFGEKYVSPGQDFTDGSSFMTSQNPHTGEKPHVCRECGRAFSQTSSLSAHRRIHTGEKIYFCNECGRGFNRRAILIKHQVAHTQVRTPLFEAEGTDAK